MMEKSRYGKNMLEEAGLLANNIFTVCVAVLVYGLDSDY